MNISGRLRHIIDIQTRTDTQDTRTGEVTVSWTTKHRGVRASIEPLSVREFIQSGADQNALTARIMIRYIPGLTGSMRILAVGGPYNGRTFNAQGFLSDTKTGLEYITIPCTEGVNEG